MISTSKITEIFFIIDEFCKEFEKAKDEHIVKSENGFTATRRDWLRRISFRAGAGEDHFG
jgi:hypothetical protein